MQRFATIPQALEDLRQGKMIILLDSINRENEGDLVIAAQHITPAAINFMTKNGRGLICLTLPEKHIERFQLPMMAENNQSKFNTAFTVSVGAARGITTGISAHDRSATIKVMMDPAASRNDIVCPGHIFPLRGVAGGVLERPGHTEASIDLTQLAGLQAGAVLCEIMNDDGSMARLADLEVFAEQHKLVMVNIEDLIAYRKQTEIHIQELASAQLPLENHGDFLIKVFNNELDPLPHLALIHEAIDLNSPVLVRIHSECLTGDIFGSARCDCGWQLDTALSRIKAEQGILIYLRQEGRGIGLINKIKAYALQDQGFDTVEANHKLGFDADQRDFTAAAHILRSLGIKQVKLMTNNPQKAEALSKLGINVVCRESLEGVPTQHNQRYLQTKRDKLGHLLNSALNY